jgi:hypothetical protein
VITLVTVPVTVFFNSTSYLYDAPGIKVDVVVAGIVKSMTLVLVTVAEIGDPVTA